MGLASASEEKVPALLRVGMSEGVCCIIDQSDDHETRFSEIRMQKGFAESFLTCIPNREAVGSK
jgi:hypothetical protein